MYMLVVKVTGMFQSCRSMGTKMTLLKMLGWVLGVLWGVGLIEEEMVKL